MIPNSKQSGASEAQRLRITQAGPDLVKKFAYLDAEVARQHDPQLAALYYDQMVHHGKHHCQAVCACATHLLDRIWAGSLFPRHNCNAGRWRVKPGYGTEEMCAPSPARAVTRMWNC